MDMVQIAFHQAFGISVLPVSRQSAQVHSDGKLRMSSSRRRATIKEFYAVILPSLQHLNCNSSEGRLQKGTWREKMSVGSAWSPALKWFLLFACHSMCINCYHDWSTRSESCPFCRGTLKRVKSGNLWVLTCSSDVVGSQTMLKEDMLRFYLYINGLPKDISDALFLMHFEYLF
nr:hypothetical protein CFP56_58326 [Quercus suber]